MFESLDDAEVRTAGTTYLMYRGRHRHEPVRDSALSRVAAALMPHPVMGPRELFYADIFASRRTPCRSGLGHARHPRPPLRLRLRVHGRARPVRLPAALAARQRLALAQARARGPAPIARAGRPAARAGRKRGGRPRPLPGGARGDRHGRPLPGTGRGRHLAAGRALRAGRARAVAARLAGTGPRRGRKPSSRGSPCAPRSARRWSTRCTRPSATRCGRRSSRWRWRSTASTS